MDKPLRLAVFDVDGTLIDSQHAIVAAMAEAWRVHGLGAPDTTSVRRIIGLSLVEAVAALLPEMEEAAHVRIAHSYKEAFGTLCRQPDHEEPMFPGAREAIAALAADGWLIGLATGKSRRGVWRMLDAHGLEGCFQSIQTADDNPGKPHPAMLVRAMAETGASACDTVMIGDTSYDMLMARSAGVAGIGVAWGNHLADELVEAGACHILDHYADLPACLVRLQGRERFGAHLLQAEAV